MLGFLQRDSAKKTHLATTKTRATWFGHISSLFLHDRPLNSELLDDLEDLLLAADVGLPTTDYLLVKLKNQTKDLRVSTQNEVFDVLKQEMKSSLLVATQHPIRTGNLTPHVILVVGVNGVGKTTSIAKLAHLYRDAGQKVLIGAADTFRAAAIDQIQEWGRRLDIDVISHQPGADAGAVAFDVVEAAIAREANIAIIDTAGRLHTQTNLMEEIKKVQRIISRRIDIQSQTVILTMDATTGQNGLLQAKKFTEALQCDGIFLAKLDSSAKGGVVLAIANELHIPVLYIGTGEQSHDISIFDPDTFVESLFMTENPY